MKGSNVKRLEPRIQMTIYLYSFSEVSSFIKSRQKGTIVRNTINSKRLEFMLYIREDKH